MEHIHSFFLKLGTYSFFFKKCRYVEVDTDVEKCSNSPNGFAKKKQKSPNGGKGFCGLWPVEDQALRAYWHSRCRCTSRSWAMQSQAPIFYLFDPLYPIRPGPSNKYNYPTRSLPRRFVGDGAVI
jgi:hypothetical protein